MRASLPPLREPRLTFSPRLVEPTALRRFTKLLLPFLLLVPLAAEVLPLPVFLLVADCPPLYQLALTSCSNSFRICLPLRATMLWLGQWLSHTTANHSNIKAAFIP